jgi:hypothetical protein
MLALGRIGIGEQDKRAEQAPPLRKSHVRPGTDYDLKNSPVHAQLARALFLFVPNTDG